MEWYQLLQLAGVLLNTIGSILLGRMALLRKSTIDIEIETIATLGSAPIIEGTASAMESIIAETQPIRKVDELTLEWETEEGQREIKELIAEDRKKIDEALGRFQARLMGERRQTIWGLTFLIIGFFLLLIGQLCQFIMRV